MMNSRLRPSLALLVSAMLHAGIAFVLLGHASRPGSAGTGAAQAGPTLMVSLVSSGRPLSRASAAAPARTAGEDGAKAPERAMPAAAQAKAGEGAPAAAASRRTTEHHYFGVGELTAPAEVDQGLAAGTVLVVPGLMPQAVLLQVWVSDEGLVDRVELDSPMAEADRQRLVAAFARVRFLPGRIGRIAVHSRVSLRILVDYTLRA